jgi:DNA-binding winged helix-turn-helix (wHTH) protein
LVYYFDEYLLDSERRELRCGAGIVSLEPQVFDVLQYLIRNRARVVSKDDLIAEVWNRRVVSESTLSSRINAVRHAVGDTGKQQRLIRTMPRKGFRFVGTVRERALLDDEAARNSSASDGENESGSPRARPDAAERRQLTIMICNVIETATLSARVDPEDLRAIIEPYHEGIRKVAQRYGGYIARYTDDGVVVYFGYPNAH